MSDQFSPESNDPIFSADNTPEQQEPAAQNAPEAAAPVQEAPQEAPQEAAPEYTAPNFTMPGYSQTYYQPPVNPQPPVSEPSKKPKKAPKAKKGWTAGKSVALILACALIGGASGFGGAMLASRYAKAPMGHSTVLEGSRGSSLIDVSHIDTSKQLTPAEVYAANVNSTVGITTSVTTNFWGYQTTSAAAGSGFILSADGYILTNFHVIEKSNSITVTLYDGTAYDATLVGYDASNDIAVLKVDAENLTPAVLGNSDNLNVGDSVVAIGNPLGELTFSLTSGAVSALDREVTLSNGVTMDLIQTDCAINSGNSGGALFNLYGEVVGITNAKYSSSGSSTEASIDNIGFAIPINQVRSIVDSIIEKGYISEPYIGIRLGDVSEEAQRYGLPAGAAVVDVVEDSPAEEAGLQPNDIITEANGTEIASYSDLIDLVDASEVGDELVLSVYRQGKTEEITVTVGERTRSAQEEQEDTVQSQQQQQIPWGWSWGF